MDENDQSEIKQCKNNVSVPINYMSLFVHFDNQTILWETIQKHPHLSVIPTNERTTWFKNHIRIMYEKIPTTWFDSPLSTAVLNELNQATLRQMMQDLQQNFLNNYTDASTTFPASSPNATVLRSASEACNNGVLASEACR